MGHRGKGGNEGRREERPVEPREARTSGNDPDAVRIDDDGGRGGHGDDAVDTRYGERGGAPGRPGRAPAGGGCSTPPGGRR